MVAMEQDGILKAIEGETSIEEGVARGGSGDFLKNFYDPTKFWRSSSSFK